MASLHFLCRVRVQENERRKRTRLEAEERASLLTMRKADEVLAQPRMQRRAAMSSGAETGAGIVKAAQLALLCSDFKRRTKREDASD